MFTPHQLEIAELILQHCRRQDISVGTAESCTGGLIAACLTSVPGSSQGFERGFVTYSNRSKVEVLGIPQPMLDSAGAVSEQVARAMAEGVLRHAPADAAVAVTGIAGPDGGTAEKPVGLVHLAAARTGRKTMHSRLLADGGRQAVRTAALEAALQLLIRQLD